MVITNKHREILWHEPDAESRMNLDKMFGR